jgi:hypothetical protein
MTPQHRAELRMLQTLKVCGKAHAPEDPEARTAVRNARPQHAARRE